MTILICGGRSFSNYQFMEQFLDDIIGIEKDVEIVAGGCPGTEKYGGALCKK